MATEDVNAKKGDAGTPGDALGVAAKAAVTWTPTPSADAKCSAAFSLGWRVGEALTWAECKDDDDLPSEDRGLPPEGRWAVLVGQIKAAQQQLAAPPAAETNGASSNGGGGAETAVAAAVTPADLSEKMPPLTDAQTVSELRDALLEQLYIADESRGKAFRLGHELQQLCADKATTLGPADARATSVKLLLVALASKLPPNAAHSVRHSLVLWEEQLKSRRSRNAEGTNLHLQGAVWRGILSGDVAAKDLLRLSDYVGTAEEVAGRLRELSGQLIRGKLLPLLILVFVLAIAGVVVLILSHHSASGVTAGATSLIAAIGLTWKGIGEFVGRAAARGEQALWNAQVDWTIAYRATLDAHEPSARPKNRGKRRRHHVDTWRQWKTKWPDLDVDPDRTTVGD